MLRNEDSKARLTFRNQGLSPVHGLSREPLRDCWIIASRFQKDEDGLWA